MGSEKTTRKEGPGGPPGVRKRSCNFFTALWECGKGRVIFSQPRFAIVDASNRFQTLSITTKPSFSLVNWHEMRAMLNSVVTSR
jgi:hypothetical protein